MESVDGALDMVDLLLVIGIASVSGLIGLLYWGYWNARKLDRQIRQGDPSLLTTNTYKREEIIQAPMGSTIMEGQIVNVPIHYASNPMIAYQKRSQD